MRTLLLLSFLSTSIPTANMDLNRTNANTSETILTPSGLAVGKFGLLGNYPVDGYMLTQPLLTPLLYTGGATHDLLILVTLNNSVYAYDANVISATPVWSNRTFATPYTGYPVSESTLYSQGIGCISTPVADVVNLKLYVVCDTVSGSTPNWVIRQLDLTTGTTLLSTNHRVAKW